MPIMEVKRKADDMAVVPVAKRARNELSAVDDTSEAETGPRNSSLLAPIMLLEGHQGEIYTAEFHPEGQYLASSGFDRQIYIWNTYGECENVSAMSGHTGAITELHFSTDGSSIYTASTDKMLGIWDIEAGVRVKKLKGHTSFVNSCHPTRRGVPLVVSGSDDCSVRVWDPRQRSGGGSSSAITLNAAYQVTAVSFNDTAEQVFSGGIDNDVKVWDLRKTGGSQPVPLMRLRGHSDTVTGLALSPDGSYALSNAMDSILRIWDVRPYAPPERCVKILAGHHHNFEKNLLRCAWSPDGSQVSAGSADRFLYIWDTTSRRVLYKLPGHKGSVNDVHFHPKEPIILSASSDKNIFLGEIE
ncbi:U5 small nuclear ribonucleoprotein 40 kDa protein [Hetaerina americana]|uniref:U5 small nuclear ribonucleoprotein 40 kDa protein n=1 Tax=Hetaerina americana TaxID=62018 RepID=UPI003A7F31E8